MSDDKPFHVAIVGGGLCGIALAIALKARNISFTIYEAKQSFTEIGAGINLGPSALLSLRLIDPSLGEKILKLATRNPAPNEDVWFQFKYGAPSGDHKDGELIFEIKEPPMGNATFHRQELLHSLASEMGVEHAKFNKKFVKYEQNEDEVTMTFADGTEETASLLIACDGIHSKVRIAMFGEDNIVSKAHFSHAGLYRKVVPMEQAVAAIGESARQSQMHFGPGGYLITYPVSGGTALNCGAWHSLKEPWKGETWLMPRQGAHFQKQFAEWGERAKKILAFFDADPDLWGSFQHTHQPGSVYDGRVMLIGDAAHGMPPHQGSGASQAVEDSYVLAEVLAVARRRGFSSRVIDASLQAVESVRKPRTSRVHRYSSEGGPRWLEFYEKKLAGQELEEWIDVTKQRLDWIWLVDMAGEAEKAKLAFEHNLM
jgi:salicylate hydroxylase